MMPLYDWSRIAEEHLNSDVTRQVVHADNVTVARIHLARGAVVPEHSHVNEQITMLLAGRVKIVSAGDEQIVEAGQVIQTRSGVPHRLEALEDTLALDVFAPRREDWIRAE